MTITPLIFGEVLFDCFPDGREVLGGAPFNVAWNLQAFGMNPLFISRVGDDYQGTRIRNKMKAWSMDTSRLQVDPVYPTGKVSIELTDGEPQFSILPDQAYDNIIQAGQADVHDASFLYHGSLALRNDSNRTVLAGLKRNSPCPVFVDVNLREPWWNEKTVLQMIGEATWLKLNENELDALFPDNGSLEQRSLNILKRFDMETVFVTRGHKGALACTKNQQIYSVQPHRHIAVTDTVGAGDAFSSVLLLGLMNNWPLDTILDRAQGFASAVVGQRGATTEDKKFYQAFKNKWDMA